MTETPKIPSIRTLSRGTLKSLNCASERGAMGSHHVLGFMASIRSRFRRLDHGRRRLRWIQPRRRRRLRRRRRRKQRTRTDQRERGLGAFTWSNSTEPRHQNSLSTHHNTMPCHAVLPQNRVKSMQNHLGGDLSGFGDFRV